MRFQVEFNNGRWWVVDTQATGGASGSRWVANYRTFEEAREAEARLNSWRKGGVS